MSLRPAPWPIMSSGAARRAAAEVHGQEQLRPQRQKRARPDLRVLEGGRKARSLHLTARRRFIFLVAVVGLVLFGVVAFHVILSQGEFRLQHLTAKADAQQDQYERLRLQVSQLESPARITSQAQGLGMVTPDKVTPVTPTKADMPNGPVSSYGSASAGDASVASTNNSGDPGHWSQVKPQLSSTAK